MQLRRYFREDLRLVAQLVDQRFDIRDPAAAFALRGLDHLQRLEARRDIHTQRRRSQRFQRLLLGLHDVRQRRVARLVQAQIRCDDGRQAHLDGFEPAVDLTFAGNGVARDIDLRGERCLRPIEQRGQHLARLVGIVVDCLLTENDHPGLFPVDDGAQQLCHGKGLQLFGRLNENRAVGAQRQSRAQRLLCTRGTAGNRDDLRGDSLLPETNSLLDRDLVEGIHRHLDVGRFDARSVGPHTDLDVEVDDSLGGNEEFHRLAGLDGKPNPTILPKTG